MFSRFVAPGRRARQRLALVVALAGGFVALRAAPTLPEEPRVAPDSQARVFQEDWYRVLLGGEPAGYAHNVLSRLGDGTVISESYLKMTVRRAQVPIEMETEIELHEAADGAIESARTVMAMSKQETVNEARVSGDELEVVVETSGSRRTLTVPYDPRARGSYWLDREATRRLEKPGDRFRAVTFEPSQLKCTGVELRFERRESIDVPGAPPELRRIGIKFDILPGVEMTNWIDGEGVLWKSLQKLPGLTIVQVKSSREEALRAGSPESPPELLLATSVKPDRPLPRGGKIESAVFRVQLKKGDFESLELENTFRAAGQTLVREESPSSRVVRVGKVEAPSARLPLEPDPALADSLTPSGLIQSDDAEIRSRARSVVAGERNAFRAAKKLERWVHDHIRKKDLSTGFASAKETLETARGDCTEHGVLLAALARAADIPARIVTGLVYHEGRFIGHLWTEVHIDGWVPLDATRPDEGVGPTHIALVASNLSDASGLGAFLDLASLVGNLKIEILEP